MSDGRNRLPNEDTGHAPPEPHASPAQVALMGSPIDRLDGRLKVTGAARYATEIPLDRLAHGWMLQSAITKGEIEEIDTSAALAAPGVVLVLTAANAPKVNEAPDPGDKRLFLLQDRGIRFNRQNIGVVVAETLEQARYAASLVKFRYKTEKSTTEMLPSLPRVPPASGKVQSVKNQGADSSRGDAGAALESAPVRINQTYISPVETHNPMEPHATTAVWDGDTLTVYDSTQGIFNCRNRLAKVFGLPQSAVRVVCHFTGGGFGSKGSAWAHVPLVAMAARLAGRPVRLALGRPQLFGPVGFRPELQQHVALGADQAGTLTAIRHDSVNHTSSFDEFVDRSALEARSLYACPNVATTHRLVKLDTGTPTFMRAPGESTGLWALESAMDELAYATGVDPVELRLRNYTEIDPDENKPWSSKSLRECYRVGAERFGWAKRSPEPRSMRQDGKLIGWGMATAAYPAHRVPASARARIFPDGSVVVQSGSQELGTGTYTVMAQLAAEVLGVPVGQVRFELGDTSLPQAPLSAGSFTATSVGSAVFLAATVLRDKLAELAISDPQSPLHGATLDGVTAGNGGLSVVADAGRSDSYAALLARQKLPQVEAQVQTKPTEEEAKYSGHSFGAQFVEVQVDPDLGEVRVTRWTGVFGGGRVLNAKTARSQLLGGMVWGIGMALMEETVFDHRYGRVLNADLAEYHVPVNADIRNFDIVLLEENDPHINPIGAKGLGEISICGAAPAIANAVYHATGRRIRELPITPDKLI